MVTYKSVEDTAVPPVTTRCCSTRVLWIRLGECIIIVKMFGSLLAFLLKM